MSDEEIGVDEDYFQSQPTRAEKQLKSQLGDTAIKKTDQFRVRKGDNLDVRKHLTAEPRNEQLMKERLERNAKDRQIIADLAVSESDDRFTLWRDMLNRLRTEDFDQIGLSSYEKVKQWMSDKITTEEESCIVRQAIQCSSTKRINVMYDIIAKANQENMRAGDQVPGNIKFYEILQLLNSLSSQFRSTVGTLYAENLGKMNMKGFDDYKSPKPIYEPGPEPVPNAPPPTAAQLAEQNAKKKIDDDDYASSSDDEEEVSHIKGPDISPHQQELSQKILHIVEFCFTHRNKLIELEEETIQRISTEDRTLLDKLRIAIILKQIYKNIRVCFEHERARDMEYIQMIPNPYVQHQGMKGLKNWMFRQYRAEMNCQYYFMYMSVRQVRQNATTRESDIKEEYFKIQRHFSNTFARLYGRFRDIFSYLLSWKHPPHPFALSTYPVHSRTTNSHKIHTFMWPDRIMNTLDYGSESSAERMLIKNNNFADHARKNFPTSGIDVELNYEIIDDSMDLYYWIKFRDSSLDFTYRKNRYETETKKLTKQNVMYQTTLIEHSDELDESLDDAVLDSRNIFSPQELVDIEHVSRYMNGEFDDEDMVEQFRTQNEVFSASQAYVNFMTTPERFCIKNIHEWKNIPQGYADDIFAAYNGKKILQYQGKENVKIYDVLRDDPHDDDSYLKDAEGEEIESIAPDQTTIFSQSISDPNPRETVTNGSYVGFTDRTHFLTRNIKHWKNLTPGIAGDMLHMKLTPAKVDIPHIWYKTTQKYMKPKHSNKDVKKMKDFEGWFGNVVTIDVVQQSKSALDWKAFPDWVMLMFKTLAHIAFNSKKNELEKKLIYVPLDRVALNGFVPENLFIHYMKNYLNFAVVGDERIAAREDSGIRKDAFFLNAQEQDFVLDYVAKDVYHVHSTFVSFNQKNRDPVDLSELNIENRKVRTTPYELFLIRPAPTMQEVWKMFQFYIVSKLFNTKDVSQNIPNLKTFLETDFELKSSRITSTSNKDLAKYYTKDKVKHFAEIDPYAQNLFDEEEENEDEEDEEDEENESPSLPEFEEDFTTSSFLNRGV